VTLRKAETWGVWSYQISMDAIYRVGQKTGPQTHHHNSVNF